MIGVECWNCKAVSVSWQNEANPAQPHCRELPLASRYRL
jgi:hypothetical protein